MHRAIFITLQEKLCLLKLYSEQSDKFLAKTYRIYEINNIIVHRANKLFGQSRETIAKKLLTNKKMYYYVQYFINNFTKKTIDNFK